MNKLVQMMTPLLLAGWALSLVACKAYLYTEVMNDTPQPCRITWGDRSYELKPGETMFWPVCYSEPAVPVQIAQGDCGALAVPDVLSFRKMARCKRGRLWSTLFVIPYIRETLILTHDDAGRLTTKK